MVFAVFRFRLDGVNSTVEAQAIGLVFFFNLNKWKYIPSGRTVLKLDKYAKLVINRTEYFD